MPPIRRVWRTLSTLVLLTAVLPAASAQTGSVRADTLAVLDVRLAEIGRDAAVLDADLRTARATLQRLQTERADLDARRARLDADTRAYQANADRHRTDADFVRRLYEDLRTDRRSPADRDAYEDARVRLQDDGDDLALDARRLDDDAAALASAYAAHASRVRDLVDRSQRMSQQRSALQYERETLDQRRLRLATRRTR